MNRSFELNKKLRALVGQTVKEYTRNANGEELIIGEYEIINLKFIE